VRDIKYVAELPESEGSPWMRQFYVRTLKPYHKNQGYVMRKVENHPYADKRGYVREHRLLIEEKMGRFLVPQKEFVHHIDQNRSNNKLSNLKLQGHGEHAKIHDKGVRNGNGQFVCQQPIFSEIKYRLFNKNTNLTEIYTLNKLIATTYRKSQFEFRGRFTGLLDKKGVEIYCGDIVKYSGLIGEIKQLAGGAYYVDHPEASLKYKHQIHCEVCDTGSPLFFLSHIAAYEIEVIGNIYQDSHLLDSNPELMEEK